MNKLAILIIGLLIIGFLGYRYFRLDQNQALQASLQAKDYKSAQVAITEAVSTELSSKAKQYFHDHNNYFVSASNNICTSLQANFDVIKKIADNPIDCHAKVHSFTARMKTGSDSFLCVDQSGFSTISATGSSYIQGVQCK